MKFTLSCHEECLSNFKDSLDAAKRDMDRAINSYDKMSKEYDFRLEQIEEARRRGMASFDSERLLVRRKQMTNDLLPDGFFEVGDSVEKVSGYLYPGVVVAKFRTTAGKCRYVVECTSPDCAGMLHIFNDEQLSIMLED